MQRLHKHVYSSVPLILENKNVTKKCNHCGAFNGFEPPASQPNSNNLEMGQWTKSVCFLMVKPRHGESNSPQTGF